MGSKFRADKQAQVRKDLTDLIPALSGVAPDDELGNFDIAMAWAEENFEVHQFMETNAAKVERDYADLSAKLRVHSRLDAAAALTGLVGDFLREKSGQTGGVWRFPTTNVIDLPHALLSLLIELSDSPVHCVHTPTTLQCLRDRIIRADARWDSSSQDSDTDAEDDVAVAPGGGRPDWDDSSLSAWSDDEDEGSAGLREATEAESEGCRTDTEPQVGFALPSSYPRKGLTPFIDAGRPNTIPPEQIEHSIIQQGHVSSGSCQLAAVVARHYSAGQVYQAPWPYSSTTEWVVAREAVLMLLGDPGTLFEVHTNLESGEERFRPRCPLQVLHLSPMSLENLLAPLVSAATDLRRIRCFCGRHVSQQQGQFHDGGGSECKAGCQTSATVQAFGHSMSKVIEENSLWLMQLNTRMMKDSLTDRKVDGSLLHLRNKARPLLATVNALTRLLSAAFPPSLCGDEVSDTAYAAGTWDIRCNDVSPALLSTRLLDALYTAAQGVDGISSSGGCFNSSKVELQIQSQAIPGGVPLYQRLLVESMRPQLLFLRAWLHDGMIRDSFQEFLICPMEEPLPAPGGDVAKRAANEVALRHPRAKQFWTRAYSLRHVSIPSDYSETTGPAETTAAHARATTEVAAPRTDEEGDRPNGEQSRLCVPIILSEIANDILIGGKSVIIIAEDTTEVASQRVRGRQQPTGGADSDVLELCMARLSRALVGHGAVPPSLSASNDSVPTSPLPLPSSRMIWQDCLVSTVMAECRHSSKYLVQQLLAKHKLVSYLDALHACFFMSDGFYMSEMSLYCCATLARGEPLDDLHTLHSLFSAVLGLHGQLQGVEVKLQIPPAAATISATSARRPRGQHGQPPLQATPSPGIHAMDGLFVGFEVPWPISLVINDESCIETYNKIMRLLLQVKRAEYTLTGLFVHMRLRDRAQQRASGDGGRDDSSFEDRTAPPQEACLFQAELMHFVRTLHFYLMNRLAHNGREELVANLHAAPNVEEIAALHDRYLSKLLDHCLLAPKAKYVLDAILKILDIILEMKDRSHQQEQAASAATGWLGDLPTRFRRLHTLLRNVLSQVVLEGTDTAHFEDLSLRLNYNQYYRSRVFS